MLGNNQVGVVTAALFAAPALGATWYAKPTATGSSWANACTLNQAVAAATVSQSNPGQVWAKKGTYQARRGDSPEERAADHRGVQRLRKGACCLPGACLAQQTVCRCTALGGTWEAGGCLGACGGTE